MNVDTKTLFTMVLVAGIVGGFALNNSLFRDMTGLDDTIEVGAEAPDFTLMDPDGNEFSLSDFEGEKVVVLEFMNMRCGTCKNFEENSLKSYCSDTMPEDVEVISITQTKNADDDELAERTEETIDSEKYYVVGVEINANHLKVAKSGIVTGKCSPIKRGRSTQVWQTEITNESGDLICGSRITLMVLDKR